MTRICPACGEEICDEFTHCPVCRFDLSVYDSEESEAIRRNMLDIFKDKHAKVSDLKCPACGSAVSATDKKCKSCWFDIEQFNAESDLRAKEQFLATFRHNRAEFAKSHSKLITCEVCGSEIAREALSCPKCGAPNKIEQEELKAGIYMHYVLPILAGLLFIALVLKGCA